MILSLEGKTILEVSQIVLVNLSFKENISKFYDSIVRNFTYFRINN